LITPFVIIHIYIYIRIYTYMSALVL